jgi:hypothetical protein
MQELIIRDMQIINLGDKVWLEATSLNTETPSKKLGPRRLGPYVIMEQIGPSAYQLISQSAGRFAMCSSKPCHIPRGHNTRPNPCITTSCQVVGCGIVGGGQICQFQLVL